MSEDVQLTRDAFINEIILRKAQFNSMWTFFTLNKHMNFWPPTHLILSTYFLNDLLTFLPDVNAEMLDLYRCRQFNLLSFAFDNYSNSEEQWHKCIPATDAPYSILLKIGQNYTLQSFLNNGNEWYLSLASFRDNNHFLCVFGKFTKWQLFLLKTAIFSPRNILR